MYEPFRLLGQIKKKRNKLEQALAIFEICTKINPLCVESYLECALGNQNINFMKSIKIYKILKEILPIVKKKIDEGNPDFVKYKNSSIYII